jgi:thioredoxin 1
MNLTEFQNKIAQSEKPLVVDFWAPWCMPCRVTKPILEALGQTYADQVEFIALNADQSEEVTRHLKIYGIPTVLAFRSGTEQARVSGAQSQAAYQQVFESLATGQKIRLPMKPLDRMFRLVIGLFLGVMGLAASNWLVLGLGALVTFWGVYDRCPIWQAVTGWIARK